MQYAKYPQSRRLGISFIQLWTVLLISVICSPAMIGSIAVDQDSERLGEALPMQSRIISIDSMAIEQREPLPILDDIIVLLSGLDIDNWVYDIVNINEGVLEIIPIVVLPNMIDNRDIHLDNAIPSKLVPEPATVILLMCGMIFIARRNVLWHR